ncbi:MAG: DUF5666 domain-containing protein [Candidatus Sulfopaludibacter sp.]|nr:DUF5666 domain-containing protein [Candidatus Sulfopaludibacter sp.]
MLLFCVSAGAQDNLPVVRGIVLRRDPGVKSGELRVRDSRNAVLRYRFDPHTYIERDNRSVEAADLKPGDPVEIVSEQVPGAPVRIARSIHVLPPVLTRRPPTVSALAAAAAEIAGANLTFAGLIRQVTDSRLVLHLRDGDDQEILLRPDTVCVSNGEVVGTGRLAPNMRVSVRAARNVAGKVEAFQVVWGSILAPQ